MKSLFSHAAGRLRPEEIEHLWGEADFARAGDDFTTARRLYRRLASLGQSRALLCLGEMCREGQGEPENFTQAYIYYERAARAGEAEGYRRIGLFHRYGHDSLERNWATAQSWFQRAVNVGYGPAAAEIGELYREGGPGLEWDYSRVKEWLEKAVGHDPNISISC